MLRKCHAPSAVSTRASGARANIRLPEERPLHPEDDRDRQSRAQVANLRAACGSMGPNSAAGELVRALRKASGEFAALWERHEVARRFADHKTLIHPEIGPIELDCQVLFTEDQSQALLVLTAAPRSQADEKLRLLDVVASERFGEDVDAASGTGEFSSPGDDADRLPRRRLPETDHTAPTDLHHSIDVDSTGAHLHAA